jgi:molybdopterin-binding protein
MATRVAVARRHWHGVLPSEHHSENRFFYQGEDPMSIQAVNVRNQFKGNIKEIIRGDVLSEIDVQTPWGVVTSVITTRSVDELELKIGSEVVALVKSTEVSIAKL